MKESFLLVCGSFKMIYKYVFVVRNRELFQKYLIMILSMNFSGSLFVVSDLTSVELKLLSSAASRQWTLLFLLLQTPEVPNVLQAPEEPEQHGEEQGGAGRPARQRLQGAAAAHGAARRLALRPNTTDGLKLLRQQTEIINTWSSIHVSWSAAGRSRPTPQKLVWSFRFLHF